MKPKTYVFLFIIITILTFILGVRYGQRVEKANKTIDYLLSIPPSPSPFPTPTKEASASPTILPIPSSFIPSGAK